MRRIDHIVLHHTATPLTASPEDIRRIHVEERGWSDVGYHFIIDKAGKIHGGRHVSVVGSHAGGHNKHTIGVAAIGDNRQPWSRWTSSQHISLRRIIETLTLIYPEASVLRHCDLKPTYCPGVELDEI